MHCDHVRSFRSCLHCRPHSYIRMVQHLIECCLLLRMDRDQCVKTLAQYARIRPLVTLTVWRELLKENRGFFQAYFHELSPKPLMSKHFDSLSSVFISKEIIVLLNINNKSKEPFDEFQSRDYTKG